MPLIQFVKTRAGLFVFFLFFQCLFCFLGRKEKRRVNYSSLHASIFLLVGYCVFADKEWVVGKHG
jgi:hypothetical protein